MGTWNRKNIVVSLFLIIIGVAIFPISNIFWMATGEPVYMGGMIVGGAILLGGFIINWRDDY